MAWNLSALTAACNLLQMRLLLRCRSSKELFQRICARGGGAARVSTLNERPKLAGVRHRSHAQGLASWPGSFS